MIENNDYDIAKNKNENNYIVRRAPDAQFYIEIYQMPS